MAFTYMFNNADLYQMEVNLFMALIIDIFVVAIIKGELNQWHIMFWKDEKS